MKSLLLYLAMVGLPLAGLFGILHAGSRIDAPPSVGGSWRIDAPASASTRTIDVSQSGEHVVVEVDGARLRGEVRGDSLFAAAPGRCGLRVRIDRAAEPDRLVGTMGGSGRGCGSTAISAARLPATKRGGRH
ncbi:MAG TPA: hypothetical protein VFR81_05895 [Longimicrobium sp.]|nr:hypothetical protein [Longimicrobium sp.]